VVIEVRGMRWAGLIARTGAMSSICRSLFGTAHVEDLGVDGDVMVDLRETGCGLDASDLG